LDAEVIVVGANVAGSSISYELAKRGHDVIVIEHLERSKIGALSCGDGVDKLEFERLGLELEDGEWVHGDVIRGKVFAPDMKSSLAAQGYIRAVHRFHFCQHLVDRAVEAGAKLIDRAKAVEPIIEKNYVTGVKLKIFHGKSVKSKKLRAKIIVDASGLNAAVRKKLPDSWLVAEKIDRRDISVCYKESREFPKPLQEKFIHGYFSTEIAPGGFYWIATRSLTKVNVGLGLKYDDDPKKQLNPKKQLYNKILELHPFVKESEVKWSGGGLIPRRRPLDCMVGNGFIAVGDAGAMVNPMSGGGIGPSMYAGKLGGKVVHEALENDDVSLENLWKFNYEFNNNYGHVQASNQILRLTIEGLADEQINALLGANLFSETEIIEAIESGKLDIGFLSKLKKVGKLARHPKLIMALRRMYKGMERAREIYKQYPETPDGIDKWRTDARKFFNKYY
jgi:geranylgeranyl reductase family protein